ncbi:MAG: hypothetical protein JJT78_02380 [Leptospira sp.]|nr:hypothetical protein [Leptospira sp.]
MSFLKKKLFIRSIFILSMVLAAMGNCAKNDKDGGVGALLLALAQNDGDPNAVSIIEVEVRDIASYQGRCFDTFRGMTAGAYYELHYPEAIRNLPTKKSVTSDEPCSVYRFPGGVENRLDGTNVSFRSYSCGPMTSLCNSSAIEKAGF